MQTINVLFLTAEADPLVKVGGLGDVAGSLPRALQLLTAEETGGDTIDIRLVMPFHSVIHHKFPDVEFLFEFEVLTPPGPIPAQAYQLTIHGVKTYLIAGPPVGEGAPVYDPDATINGRKYFFFSLAALEMVKKLAWKPDILHANDWHTALAVYALELRKTQDLFFKDTHSVLTVHNLLFMGAGTEAAFDSFGLPTSQNPLLPWWAKKFPLPLGLQSAERITTVSPTYAQEIMTPEYGFGLEGLLQARQKVLSGIVNGLDQESWDPAIDPHIAQNFTTTTLAKRQHNKSALIREFSLNPDPKIPLLILISRLDQQKGVDLVIESLAKAAGGNWQALLLGTGDTQLEDSCRQLEKDHPDQVRAAIRFDIRLSRRMYAGGDILLMPSRFEPCGLAQMMAMRYGCVPLARATGGLQDTIVDIAESENHGTGFLFTPATADALTETIRRALAVYPDQARWSAIQRRGMRQDFSWDNSALKYVKLYQDLLKVLA